MKGSGELTVYETLQRPGAATTVCRVRGRRTGVLKSAPEHGSAARRLLNEVEVLRRVTGPHLPVLLEHGVDDGEVWLLLQDHGSETLAELWGRQPPGFIEALDVLEQVGSALATLHAAGVVHRDVKGVQRRRRAVGADPHRLRHRPRGEGRCTDDDPAGRHGGPHGAGAFRPDAAGGSPR